MRENEIKALKSDLEIGIYTVNEVREKLGEPRVNDPEADQLLVFSNSGWHHLDNTPATSNIEALLPRAFASLGNSGD